MSSTKLQTAIDKFLAEKRESFMGYAETTEDDLKDLRYIVDLLIKEKCEADPDGDYPIQVIVNDTKNYEPFSFRPVPRLIDDITTKKDLDHIEEKHIFNLEQAMSRFQSFRREKRFFENIH